MDESAELKYSRLQTDIQSAILQGFPNPERCGCPDEAAVGDLARHPDQITAESDFDRSSVWFHITHCSPCYAAFLEMRRAEHLRRQNRSTIRLWAAALAVAACLGWLLYMKLISGN